MIPPTWWAIAGLTAALGASGYLLYGAIEDKGRLAATIEAKDKALAKLADDIKRQEVESKIRGETYEAGDRAVVIHAAGVDSLKTRTQVIFHEVQRANDCHDPVGPGFAAAFARLRVIDRHERARRGDQGGNPGAPRGPVEGAAAPRGAVTNCAGGEYLVRLYEYALGLEGQIYGIGDWVAEAKRIRAGAGQP